jgi:hypothetical protein
MNIIAMTLATPRRGVRPNLHDSIDRTMSDPPFHSLARAPPGSPARLVASQISNPPYGQSTWDDPRAGVKV